MDLQQNAEYLAYLEHDLDDAVYANDETCLRLRCGVPGQPNLVTLTTDVEGSDPGQVIPSEHIIQATKKALSSLEVTSLWSDNSVVIVKVELVLVNTDNIKRQAQCLFGRHGTKEVSMCTSMCRSCGHVFCHCTQLHCCCPDYKTVEQRNTTILTIGRLRFNTEHTSKPILSLA